MAGQNDPYAISLLVKLPEGATAEQAEALSKAFESMLIDFGRAMQVSGKNLKIEAVQGPAEPITPPLDVSLAERIPAVVLKHAAEPVTEA